MASFPGIQRRQAEMLFHLGSRQPIVYVEDLGLTVSGKTVSDCEALELAQQLFDADATSAEAEIRDSLDREVRLRIAGG